MKPTLRIDARDAVTAGLAASAWLAQGGSRQSWPVPMTRVGFALGTTGTAGTASTRGQCGTAAATPGNQKFFETRHEINTPVYRELAM